MRSRLARAGWIWLLAWLGVLRAGGEGGLPLLAPCFGSNMVLRRPEAPDEERVVLWGWVPKRLHVSIQVEGTNRLVAARSPTRAAERWPNDDLWSVQARDLESMLPPRGAFSLTVRLHKAKPGKYLKPTDELVSTETLTNVVVGAVWAVRVAALRGVPHSVRELPPEFRVLRASDVFSTGRSAELRGHLEAPPWQVLRPDSSQIKSLPGLVAYAAQHYFTNAGAGQKAPLGILVVEQALSLERGRKPLNDDGLMAKSFEKACRACGEDEAEVERQRLDRKRRGRSTYDLPSNEPTVGVDRRPPPLSDDFFYDVDGFFW